jgi:hypothetical protein
MTEQNEKERIEPSLGSAYPLYEEFVYRPIDTLGTDMGVPFAAVIFEGTRFYRIKDTWWQISHIGSDDKGIFVKYYKIKGTVE